jgi:hypothetical protein
MMVWLGCTMCAAACAIRDFSGRCSLAFTFPGYSGMDWSRSAPPRERSINPLADRAVELAARRHGRNCIPFHKVMSRDLSRLLNRL